MLVSSPPSAKLCEAVVKSRAQCLQGQLLYLDAAVILKLRVDHLQENHKEVKDQRDLIQVVHIAIERGVRHQRLVSRAKAGNRDEAGVAVDGRSKSTSQKSRRSSKGSAGKINTTSLPAKPSELRVEPPELSYKAIGGLKGVNIINETTERKFFKVRCSDNMLYRVNPVFGVVEPGRSARIDILRQNGAAKIDKMVLVTTKAEDGELPSREVFNRAKNTEMMVLPLLVQE
ncbi:MSP domain protein [Dictyocaulus viviparus]|uniref:Major sperm protein n=1 Tax=Dictyocaulus viviparus TaxID=29172 RepID=A0A0D8XLU3_DICVI|nr:MSP domain protein [Dictyocaulus viviparus]